MKLIYHIDELFLRANATIAKPESTHPTFYSSQSFYTYCSDHTPFGDQFQGTYRSTAPSVEQYFNVFGNLWSFNEQTITEHTKHFVTMAILFDFMAYNSYGLRDHCGSAYDAAALEKGKLAIIIFINVYEAIRDTTDSFAQILCAIVANFPETRLLNSRD